MKNKINYGMISLILVIVFLLTQHTTEIPKEEDNETNEPPQLNVTEEVTRSCGFTRIASPLHALTAADCSGTCSVTGNTCQYSMVRNVPMCGCATPPAPVCTNGETTTYPNYLLTKATCTDPRGAAFADYCFDDDDIVDYYCGPTGNSSETRSCLGNVLTSCSGNFGSNYICRDGACIIGTITTVYTEAQCAAKTDSEFSYSGLGTDCITMGYDDCAARGYEATNVKDFETNCCVWKCI